MAASNVEVVVIMVGVGAVCVVGVVVAWKLFLAMVSQFTGAVRRGVRSQEEQDLIELGRVALAEVQALRQEQLNVERAAINMPEPVVPQVKPTVSGISHSMRRRHT